jgi:hypothetical protein
MDHELHSDTGFDALRSVTALLRGEKYESMISRTSSVSVKVIEIDSYEPEELSNEEFNRQFPRTIGEAFKNESDD